MDTKYLLHLTAEVYFQMHKHINYKLNIQEIFTKKLKVQDIEERACFRCPALSILTLILLELDITQYLEKALLILIEHGWGR